MLFGGNYPNNDSIKLLTPEDFKKQIHNKKVQLIDIRTSGEFRSGSIKGSKNIDFYSSSFNTEFSKLKKDKAVYIFCRTGTRSRHAANKLAKMGFTNIIDLKGGIVRWN